MKTANVCVCSGYFPNSYSLNFLPFHEGNNLYYYPNTPDPVLLSNNNNKVGYLSTKIGTDIVIVLFSIGVVG
jgi:hypothetical protein